jgi:ATP-dependent Lon protease
MLLPLYLITKSDGIPMPGNSWVLDVPSELIPYFKSQIQNNKNQLIIGISSNEETLELYDNISELAIYTENIALLCTVLESAESESFLAVTLSIEDRVYIRHIEQIEDHDTETRTTLVKYEVLVEDPQPSEKNVHASISKIETEIILKNRILFNKAMIKSLKSESNLIAKMNIIANHLITDCSERIKYLQQEDHTERCDMIITRITDYIENHDTNRSKATVINRTSKTQIHNAASIKSRFSKLRISDDIKQYIQRELNKLDSLPKASAEHSMVLDYMSWILDIPWDTYSSIEYKLSDLVSELSTTHYGLDNVKAHILEHMTIEKIKQSTAGTILCFLGEPGTGKTSIAKAIAEVTNRKLVRIAMGGLSDEAEIRGHRRTYQSSRPGRIIAGLKQAGTMNPLFVLDEIDKITMHKGDPYSALLEVLDKEQQDHFVDRYLEIPIDLSKAMWICTANYEEQIPEALRDRMEFIYFKQYKKPERKIIAEKHLLPKAIDELGLADYNIQFQPETLDELSALPNVRSINKRIHKLLRMAAVDLVIHHQGTVTIDNLYNDKVAKNNTHNLKTTIGFKL